MAKVPVGGKKRKRSAPRRLTWAYVLLALLLFGMMYGRNLSGDVWWHLKTGQWIVEHHAFPYNDPFSYTARNPIILHEWGAEVIDWLVYSRIAPSALAAMSVLLICAAFALVFRLAVVRSRDVLASFLVVAAGASASASASEMRPQVFSFVFLALAALILQRYHERGGRTVWLLTPLIVIWVNFHSIFSVGLALIALEVVAAAVRPPEWARKTRRPSLAAAGPLAAAGVAGALLALVNPNGIEPYLYPLHVLRHAQATSITAEWMPPDLGQWTGRSLAVLLGMAVIGLVSIRGRAAFRDLVCAAIFAAVSLRSQRHAVLFAISCAGPIAVWLSAVFAHAELRVPSRFARAARGGAWAVLTVLVAVLFIWRVSDARGRSAFDYMNMSEVFPAAACDFIQASDISGPMFNEYNYGGYLIWRLWPQHRVFVDSRQEPFLGGTFEESFEASSCSPPGAWQRVFKKHGINFAVLTPGTPLAFALAEQPEWARVYADDRAEVFVRDIPANAGAVDAAGGR